MPEIVVIEDGCCHAGELEGFTLKLRERLGERATVTAYAVGGHLGFSAVPPDLTKSLLEQGAKALPVIAVDGQLVSSGELGDEQEVIRLVEQRLSGEPVTELQA
jgi:hypothetical protein